MSQGPPFFSMKWNKFGFMALKGYVSSGREWHNDCASVFFMPDECKDFGESQSEGSARIHRSAAKERKRRETCAAVELFSLQFI